MRPALTQRAWILWVAACVLAACALHAPSLNMGWFGDDYAHRRFILDHLRGAPSATVWWNMFDWRSPDRDALDPGSLFGRLPWWAGSDFSFALLRPLSTVSHYLDYLLWPNTPWAMHLHNLLLVCALVATASVLYRHLFDSALTAWLGLALFAVDDALTISAGWIASRNTLLTANFVLLTVAAYARAARRGSRPFEIASLLALAGAHASSEGGIVAWAYLLAFTLFLDSRPMPLKQRSLAPLALLSLSWVTLSALAGYGVHGSGVYLDPRHDPISFMRGVQERMPGLLELQFGIPPEFQQQLGGELQGYVSGACWLYLAVLAGLSASLWRRSAVLRFCACASFIALVPQCAAGSFARLLPLSGFAAHGLMAILVEELLRARSKRAARIAGVSCAVFTLTIHVLAAAIIPTYARAFSRSMHESVSHAAQSLPHASAASGERIVVLNFPDYLRSVFTDLYRRELFGPALGRMDVIGISPAPVRLTRLGSDSIELEPVVGFLYEPSSLLVRQSRHWFRVGQRFELDGLRVEVASVTADGHPARIRLQQVTRPGVRWFRWSWQAQRFVEIRLPSVGDEGWLDSGAFDGMP